MSVFLSYHTSRERVVQHVAEYLARRGITTWFAPRDIPGGADWDEAIASAIRASEALILLFCSSADSSLHVKREIMLADKAKVPIYWLRLERVEPDKLGYLLGSTQWIDWLDERDATLDTLVRDLGNHVHVSGDSAHLTPLEPGLPAATPRPQPVPRPWPRSIISMPSERQAAEVAAHVYFQTAQSSPDSTVILPTGRAATHVFRAMVRLAKHYGPRPFGDAHIINDTETFGVWPGHHTSRTRHVRESLIEPLRDLGFEVDEGQLHLLSGIIMEQDPLRAAQRTIRLWPPSIHAVSISPTGEALAYEVGTYLEPNDFVDDGVRVIELTEHGKSYIDPDQPSRSVLTIGFGTALSAERLMVLAFDGQKANILYRIITGEPVAGIPATLLRRHLNAHVLTLDAVIQEIGYSELVEPRSVDEAVATIMGDRS